jgi:ferrous-iron efflux pump FieF
MVETVRKIVEEIAGPARCHDVMIRRQGEKHAVSLHCRFEKDLPIIEAHRLSSEIEEAVKQALPSIENVLVHTEPDGR